MAAVPGEVEMFPLPGTDKEFFTDLLHLTRLSSAGPVLSYCHHRLTLLEQKFNLHSMLNASKETLAQKTAPHRDFYNVRKVRFGKFWEIFPQWCCCDIRVRVDVLCTIHACALGKSPVTSFSVVKNTFSDVRSGTMTTVISCR